MKKQTLEEAVQAAQAFVKQGKVLLAESKKHDKEHPNCAHFKHIDVEFAHDINETRHVGSELLALMRKLQSNN